MMKGVLSLQGIIAVLAFIASVSSATSDDDLVVGIDLGTSYSCVAIYQNDQAQVIANNQGNRITPSVVAFTADEGRLIGEAAKNQAPLNPKNTLYDIKRLIGRTWKSKRVQEDIARFPFKVIDQKGKPNVEVKYAGDTKVFQPEEISGMVLTEMKRIAEDFLGRDVKRAVVTVPAYFNDDQRLATKMAGKIAGLEVERIINEPTAASIAYGLDTAEAQTILVFDLGGGTFDVSLLSIADGVFQVLATSGDTHLGGEDINDRLQDHFAKRIKEKYNIDILSKKRAASKLRAEVEKLKRQLSNKMEATLSLEVDGVFIEERMSRVKFNDLCDDLFKRCLKPVEKALDDAAMDKDEVDEIVMVGGSTRIPKVQQLLRDYFDGKELHQDINPDEAVCIGAAVQGHALSGGQVALGGTTGGELLLLDVTPLTLGVEMVGGVMSPVIDRNSPIPTRRTKEYTTVSDYQSQIEFKVFQGERSVAKHNHFLGSFTLDKIAPAPRGAPKIDVTFQIDANGILQVSAEDRATKNSKKIQISGNKHKLSDDEVARMMRDAEKFAEQDRKAVERVEARNALEAFLSKIRQSIRTGDIAAQVLSDEKSKLEEAIDEGFAFIQSNPQASKADFEEKQEEVEKIWNPIIRRVYGDQGDPEGGSGGSGGGGSSYDDDDYDYDADYYDDEYDEL